jgi:hypothetical protein
LLAVGWLGLFAWLASRAHTLIMNLAAPATALIHGGEGVRQAFEAASRTVAVIPFIGDQLAEGLLAVGSAGQTLADAGAAQYDNVAQLAAGTAAMTFLAGALPLLVLWLPPRLRYARAAGAAAAARDTHADLLALRALARGSTRALRGVSADPVGDWRRGDREAVRRLARLELDRQGLRAPAAESGPGQRTSIN